MYKYKTAIAIATAASLSLSAGFLSAADGSGSESGPTEPGVSTEQQGSQKSQADQAGQNQQGSASYEDVHEENVGVQLQPSFEPNFERLDTNQDGELDESELDAYGATAAGQGDSDAQEQKQNRSQNSGDQLMDRYDTDRSGTVSEEELQQGYQADRERSGATTSGETQ